MPEAELSHGAKWALEQIEKNAGELRKEISRLETALDDRTGVIQPLKPYPWAEFFARNSVSGHGSPAIAKRAAEDAYQRSLPVKAENEKIAAGNKAVHERLVAVLKNAGLPETVRVRKPRSTKSISVDTEWKAALSQHIPLNDGWWQVQQQYDVWKAHCDSLIRQAEQQKEAAERARQEHEREINREVIRRELVSKYQLEAELSVGAVFDALLSRDKYLHLAHWLRRNRGDWSDGPWYAEHGLDGFKPETDVEHQIHREISRHITDWCGDGRVFRDCTWNYDRLFEVAAERNAELVVDYNRLRELLDMED